MVLCLFSVYWYWMICSWMFVSCYTFALYAMYMISCFEFEVWKEVGMSFNCFSIWTRVPARSAVELSARSVLSKGSDRVAFVLIHSEVQLGIRAMQGVCKPSKVLELWTWAKYWGTAAAGVRKVEGILAFGSVWRLPQVVRAKFFSKTQSYKKAQEV